MDNASKEDEASIIANRYPQVKTIRSDKNLGFAGGNNLGIQEAQGNQRPRQHRLLHRLLRIRVRRFLHARQRIHYEACHQGQGRCRACRPALPYRAEK